MLKEQQNLTIPKKRKFCFFYNKQTIMHTLKIKKITMNKFFSTQDKYSSKSILIYLSILLL